MMSKVLSNCTKGMTTEESGELGCISSAILATENGRKFHEEEIAKLLPRNMHGTLFVFRP